MAWDFSTEPEFQEKLDWVERFCREEIEPLDMVFPYAVRSKDPKVKAIVKEIHPYEVPELLVLSVSDALPAFLQWVGSVTANAPA